MMKSAGYKTAGECRARAQEMYEAFKCVKMKRFGGEKPKPKLLVAAGACPPPPPPPPGGGGDRNLNINFKKYLDNECFMSYRQYAAQDAQKAMSKKMLPGIEPTPENLEAIGNQRKPNVCTKTFIELTAEARQNLINNWNNFKNNVGWK